MARSSLLFSPITLRDVTLRNRVVVSPMDMYSAEDGVPGDFHLVHLGARALGGAGLVMTEMVCVSAEGRITPGCAGLYTGRQGEAWRRITDFVHERAPGTAIGVQLGHSGRKGSTKLMWEGMDDPLPEGGWPVVGPSPLPYSAQSQVQREMTRDEMDEVREQFVASARRAVRCGFDLLELHCAHGYLLSSFLSPVTNRRTDEYGGPIENRLRFPLEVFTAMREVWPAHKPMTVRISATDWVEGGWTGDDSVRLSRLLAERGVDLIDTSTGGATPTADIPVRPGYQVPFARQIRAEADVPTGAVGLITAPEQAEEIIASGSADVVLLGRTVLNDPRWPLRAADRLRAGDLWPKQYERARRHL